MSREYYLKLAVKLCCADLTSEFISLQPVLGTRDELLDQRLTWYCELLERIDTTSEKGASQRFPLAVALTCADIESGAIAVAPVLYDRDEKIEERLAAHLIRLCGRVSDDEPAVKVSEGPSTEWITPSPTMQSKKGKKKKKRR